MGGSVREDIRKKTYVKISKLFGCKSHSLTIIIYRINILSNFEKKILNLLVFFNERAYFHEAVMSMYLLCYVLHFLDFILPTYIAISRV